MKKVLVAVFIVVVAAWVMRGNLSLVRPVEHPASVQGDYKEIDGTIGKGETLFDVFRKLKLDIADLFKIREASAGIYRLREVRPGQPYKITIDDKGIRSFEYWINDDSILSVNCEEGDFCATRKLVHYDKRVLHLSGIVTGSLVESTGQDREDHMLALRLSDIFAWDIDFTSDLRNGDTFNVVVEGLYLGGEFRKYGEILSAEFVNDGELYRAYRFGAGEEADYFDAEGKSLRKAFLKAPLSFRRISAGFSGKRFHPILKIHRPHHGLDYAAPEGTAVSAVGDGTALFAGRKGGYGNLVIIKHPNGWQTYYGHLSRIAKGVRRGAKVSQGSMIGRVGSTGLATGPHLHYEVRIGNKPVNPLEIRLPRCRSIPHVLAAEFERLKNSMDTCFISQAAPALAFAERDR